MTVIGTGREIAQARARETIDLIILDLKLPGEDGMQIARELRAESDIPIIMLTGRKDEADRVMGLELGADDYLTKPFSPREHLQFNRLGATHAGRLAGAGYLSDAPGTGALLRKCLGWLRRRSQ